MSSEQQELHIASVVVSARHEQLSSIRSCVESVPGAEVHHVAAGKMIVTLETESTRRTVDIMDAIRALPGVIDAVLIYQHAEPVSALEQEVQS
ncbi:chaperone NapD [Noviherbaspirillum galbum]|uniref:Chaperone NapD n=1 Tax=Noviherbaspirillum galbum TaxID=2709383 RepID=A0A6B3SL94_9BURK|nr:chaperone NapD [Noviherbaspirillum galbum]NEX61571.1 chaperone NapD [Noviherbaspirillum galbum]